MSDEFHETSLGLRLPEIIGIAILAIAYITMRIAFVHEQPILVAILGFLLAFWAIMRPTEWAVEGLSMLSQKYGIGTYAAGVIGSLMANLPELVLAFFLILSGKQDLAILTVLIVAGANTLLFGVVIIRSSKKSGNVKVPVSTLKYESELMIVAFMTSLFIFVYNFAEDAINQSLLSSVSIPVLFSVGTVLIYIFYLIFLAKDDELNPPRTKEEKLKIRHDPSLKTRNIVKFLLLGVIGIIIAGELLANGADVLIEEIRSSGFTFNEAYIAVIVGLLGSIPEWAIAFRAEEDVELVFGSVLSSISATLLFMIGIVSILMHFFVKGGFTLDPFGLVQIILSGSILLFVNLMMEDDLELDMFEGICIVILQIISFDILISV